MTRFWTGGSRRMAGTALSGRARAIRWLRCSGRRRPPCRRRSTRSADWRLSGFGFAWRSTPVRRSCATTASTSARRSSGARGCGRSATVARCSCRTRRAEVVGERLPDGGYLRDLGAHRLNDLGGAERVWQLCHGDLDVNFPPLRPLDAFGHNLPTRLTSLIGREADTAAVLAAMDDSRLVTLIGTGGVGKTRLALQVAAESVDHFDGGVWWVELATVSDPSSLPGAVLDAIGLPAPAGSTAGPGGRRPRRRPADVVRARQLRARDRRVGVVRRRGAEHACRRWRCWRPVVSRCRCPARRCGGSRHLTCPIRRCRRPWTRSERGCGPAVRRSGATGSARSRADRRGGGCCGSDLPSPRRDSAVDRVGRRPLSQPCGRADRPRARRPLPVAHRWRPHGDGAPADAQGVDRLEP